MRLIGRIKSIQRDWAEEKWQITLEIDDEPSEEWNELRLLQKLSIELKKFRNRRTLNANALLWSCITQIAKASGSDKWTVYMDLIKMHGKHTYICAKPSAVEDITKQWREVEIVGPIEINGTKAIQMLCYYGSSTYDSEEFAVLLEDTFYEMHELGLQLPNRQTTEKALEKWEKQRSNNG